MIDQESRYHVIVRQKERAAVGPHELRGEIHFIGIPAKNWADARKRAVKIARQIGLSVVVEHAERAL